MKCPNCSFENAADAKFCENCGQPFERACPNCGKPVSPNARFCKNCGFNLAGAAARPTPVTKTEPLDALRRAAPQNVATKILAERERMEGERKLVTALFTDIVGSTTLAEQMDPEDWREVVSGAHRRVSEGVYHYEGTIAQLLGDGVLAFFGAPLAHEDDAERAIRAALQILAGIHEYAGELRAKYRIPDFQMRIGLNTGLVVVGNIGSDLHMEYLAIGDTVNLAARVQSAAEPNAILITESTHRLAASLFDSEDRGKITVKGKAEPIQVYRVSGERKGAVRTRGIAGLSSPLVGRQREFATLMQITADARAGRGSIISIIGEAGLGKSRLVAEWRKATALTSYPLPPPPSPEPELRFRRGGRGTEGEGGAAIRWIEGRCLSYGTSMAHHLSTDILRAIIGASAGSSEEETHRALWQTTETLFGAEMKEVYPYLGHLLGLKLEEDMAARVKYLDGPALQSKYIAAYKRLLHALARSSPTVLICEDVHWADPSSIELGLQIIPMAAEAPIVFAFVTREDKDAAGWKLISQAHDIPGVGARELHLGPLSDTESKTLVSNLLEVEALPEQLRALILAKAEGNPFFVEEVIRMLIDRGGIALKDGKWTVTREIQNIEIPDTLQGVLTARIDRLSEDAKRTLQIAAVIGRKFQVKVLEKVLQAEGL
ncbi:MAG: AAA family ATPase [Chloroflexi bacterium]|nr:AAA family ATPase [Chloroflexota bacterium]